MPPNESSRTYAPVHVQGRQLRCTVCSHDVFWEHEIQLSTGLFDFLSLDSSDRVAQCAVCERCGYVHMFIPPPAALHDPVESAEGMPPAAPA